MTPSRPKIVILIVDTISTFYGYAITGAGFAFGAYLVARIFGVLPA